jgi:hypothetical protein
MQPMIEIFKELITNQYEAAFCTLNSCVDRCPEAEWNASVFQLKFCQVVFHTLFFADYYLGPAEEPLRQQPFHRQHAGVFLDYEELEDRAPVRLYEKSWTQLYLKHCRTKGAEVIRSETAESLHAMAEFARRTHSRAELHVCNIRHIQHHAAQLSLRLKIDCQRDVPWFASGWSDA